MLSDVPHRRFNTLNGEWVLVSAGRTGRPWQGTTEASVAPPRPAYDPECYLCPGNERAGGEKNPPYESTFAFTNDFAALRPDVSPVRFHDGLLISETQAGTCRVLCYSPRHDLDMATMDVEGVGRVIELWAAQIEELSRRYEWVQIFENRGAGMGASNPHPHGQVWAGDALPREPAREDRMQRQHLDSTGSVLLLDYLEQEADGERVVDGNADWTVLVPFWAVWPFELLVVPHRHVRRLSDLTAVERRHLAEILSGLVKRYDRLFDAHFPFSMGWHGAPASGGDHWQLHAHFFPPLLRSARIRKHMVGYELLAEAQRDLTPEEAAAALRSVDISARSV